MGNAEASVAPTTSPTLPKRLQFSFDATNWCLVGEKPRQAVACIVCGHGLVSWWVIREQNVTLFSARFSPLVGWFALDKVDLHATLLRLSILDCQQAASETGGHTSVFVILRRYETNRAPMAAGCLFHLASAQRDVERGPGENAEIESHHQPSKTPALSDKDIVLCET